MKWKPETHDQYLARMKRFNEAKATLEFYDTVLGAVLPDAHAKKQEALTAMWEHCNAPARGETQLA